MSVYAISGLDHNGTYIPLTNRNIDTGLNVVRTKAGGDVNPTHVTVQSIAPRVNVETHHIAAALDVTGTTGAAISSGALVTLFSRQYNDNTAGFKASTDHVKYVINEGILLPRRISATTSGATLTMEAVTVYDGTNENIVITNSQSFAGTQVVSERFITGKATINGSDVNFIQSMEIDFGLADFTVRGSGEVRPEQACVGTVAPSFTFTTTDSSFIATTGATGVVQGLTDSIFYLRKLAEGGNMVADATAEHISFTIDEGILVCNGLSGDDQEIGSYTFTPTYDGTNAIIVLDSSVAIA